MTAVIEINQLENVFALNIKPEVCSKNEIGVTIPISKKQFEAIQSLYWDEE